MRHSCAVVAKTRKVPFGFAGSEIELEMICPQLKGGDFVGKFQAQYYRGADLFIAGDCFDSAKEAQADVDRSVDELVKRIQSLRPKS